MIFLAKMITASFLISFVSWLSGKNVGIAGFLTALPLTTLLALAFGQLEWGDPNQSVEYAKSIFYAVPISLLFFVPFLLAAKLSLSFWTCYCLGLVLLVIGYFIHKFLVAL